MHDLARQFLQEAVFASRGASHAFSPRSLEGAAGCGLGLRPALPEDLSPRQGDIVTQMLEHRLPGETPFRFDLLTDHAADWIRLQDQLDRQRNHFIKDFRGTHGFDKAAWAPDVKATFTAGLDAINADNRDRLDVAAAALATALRPVPEGASSAPCADGATA